MKRLTGLSGLSVSGSVQSTPRVLLFLCLLFSFLQPLRADGDDLDDYKGRVTGVWWLAEPSGYFHGTGDSDRFDLQKDFSFNSFSTFTGFADWRFKRKHHLLFGISPVSHSRTDVLARTITYQGQTFDVGTRTTADLHVFGYSPGYQYDIIRRNHGYLGVGAQLYILDTKATLRAMTTVNGMSITRAASGSQLAPVPTIGPRFRWYPSSSSRFSVDGFIQGMYFFGYGDFWATRGTLNIGLSHHLNLVAGYQVGTDFSLHGSSDRLGIRLTEKGPVAGLEASWGSQEK